MNEPCRWVQAHLARYHDGELEPGERARIDRHLADCEACRLALAAYEEADRLLLAASHQPREAAGDDSQGSADAEFARLREALHRRYDLAAAERHRRKEVEQEQGTPHTSSPAEIAAARLEGDLQRPGRARVEPGFEEARRRAAPTRRRGIGEALRRILTPGPRWGWLGAGSAVALAALVTIVLIARDPELPQTALDQMSSARREAVRPIPAGGPSTGEILEEEAAAERATPPPRYRGGEGVENLQEDAVRDAGDEASDELSRTPVSAAKMKAAPAPEAEDRWGGVTGIFKGDAKPVPTLPAAPLAESAPEVTAGERPWERLRAFVAAAGAPEPPPQEHHALAERAGDLLSISVGDFQELAELAALLGDAWYELWGRGAQRTATDASTTPPVQPATDHEAERLLFAENALAAYKEALEWDARSGDDRLERRTAVPDRHAAKRMETMGTTSPQAPSVGAAAPLSAEARGRMVRRIEQLREWIDAPRENRGRIDIR